MNNGNNNNDGEGFGRFTLLQRLGAGGMAEVYLARLSGEAGFEKHLVIKKILPSLARDPEFVERLIQEGKLVAELTHGNIVQVQELGQEDGDYYLAMDYVAGTDLRELMGAVRRAEECFPEALAAHILLQIARALAYAHAKADPDGQPLGIIHRDISPANVLVSWEGDIKLTDFGIARVSQVGRVLTSAGMLRGKVPYMSPEQAESQELGPQSDVFSFGVLAYELLAGVRPFDGDSDILTLDRIRTCEKAPISSLRPDLDPGLAQLVDQCLEKDLSRRPANGEALERGLAALMAAKAWVVSSGEVARLVDQRFPKDCAARSRAPATGVTASGTQSRGTNNTRDRIPTKSLAAPAPRVGVARWILLGLILLLAVGAVGFGLGLVVDWHRGQVAGDGDAISDGGVQEEDQGWTKDTPPSAMAPDVVEDLPADQVMGPADDLAEELVAPDRSPADTVATLADVVPASPDTGPAPEDASPAPEDSAAAMIDSVPAAPDTAAAASDAVAAIPDVPPPADVPSKPKPSVTRIEVIPRTATIEINGKEAGKGAHMLRLQPGASAEIRLACPGHKAEVFTLKYPAPRKVSKRLWAAPVGSLKIRYLPANATLYLDGNPLKSAGGLNIVVVEAPAGPHSLRLTGPDGGEITKDVEVLEGEQTGITLRLE